jgi:hypothetical protein
VGHFLPNGPDGELDTVGMGRLYETYVFEIDGEEEGGDPNVLDWCEIDSKGYNESIDAERGHYEMCEKWADMEDCE